MNDQTSSDPDANRREFWEPIGEFVMEFGFLESAVDGVIHRALLLHEMQGETLTSQIRNLSTKISLAQQLLLILHTNSAQPAQIRAAMEATTKLNKFRNNLVHGPWGVYDLTHHFWEKNWVEGGFKRKTFRVKREEILENISRARETRETLIKLRDSVVREFLAEMKHVPWPDKFRRQARKHRRNPDRSPQ